MDRTWKNEVGHGIPISFLFKGYSLSMATSRGILNEVLDTCKASGLHVPCITFDGQFSQLKDLDDENNPVTLFAYHRQFWTNVRKLTKRELIGKMCDLFAENIVQRQQQTDDHPRRYVVQNKKPDIKPVVTEIAIIHRKTVLQTEKCDKGHIIDCNGLEETVVEILEDVVEEPIQDEVNEDIHAEATGITREENEPNPTDNYVKETLILSNDDYKVIYTLLCSSKQALKWKQKSIEDLKNIFISASTINTELTGQDLHEIVNYINIKLTKRSLTIEQSLRKAEKVNCICAVIGNDSRVKTEVKVRRHKKVKTLKTICITELQKKTYPKDAIAVAYAKCVWPTEKKTWYNNPYTFVSNQICINTESENITEDDLVFHPVYSPVYNDKRQQHEVRVMDGTHIRTNIKSKLIRSNLGNVRLDAWKVVALSGKTNLAPAMIEIHADGKIMHQQSDPYVRTMFSKEVEDELLQNGNTEEARFCKLFRDWHEAEDKAGIQAIEQCSRSLRLRNWLLEGYHFDQFPPKTQYVKGIPRVTFEGLVCSIEAYILLYGLTVGGTFNWRSVSTLVAENFMGELAERSQNNHGVPSGVSLPGDMTKISELHAMRYNPARSFQMRTAKSRAYAVQVV